MSFRTCRRLSLSRSTTSCAASSTTWSDVCMLTEEALRLAVADAIVDRMPEQTVVDKLFREDSESVRWVYREIAATRARRDEPMSTLAKRRSRSRHAGLWRKRPGLTVSAIAERFGMTVATLKALLEHHGYLECVPYGGRQRRMLVTESDFRAECGHNVTPKNRVGHLEGFAKAAPFPVLYEARLPDIMWTLGYGNIADRRCSPIEAQAHRLA